MLQILPSVSSGEAAQFIRKSNQFLKELSGNTFSASAPDGQNLSGLRMRHFQSTAH